MFSGFMLNAWIAATIVAAVAGSVGFFVVLRGATFAAHALPLGTFPGAAAAGLLGINPIWGLVLFAGGGVFGIEALARRQRRDVATALVLITLLGFGTLCLSLSGQYEQAVYGLLFGEVLGIDAAEIPPLAAVSALVILAVGLSFRPLMLTAVSAELGSVRGLSPAAIDRLFLGLVALGTAMALPVVGALLVFSLMVGPAAAARSCSRHPGRAMALSVAFALATVWSAVALSYWTDWPVGFFVGTLAALVYGVARGTQSARRAGRGLSPGRRRETARR